jgi:hypothetical protein
MPEAFASPQILTCKQLTELFIFQKVSIAKDASTGGGPGLRATSPATFVLESVLLDLMMHWQTQATMFGFSSHRTNLKKNLRAAYQTQ